VNCRSNWKIFDKEKKFMTSAKILALESSPVEDQSRLSFHTNFRCDSIPQIRLAKLVVLLLLVALFAHQAKAQNPPLPPPPSPPLAEKQLENLVTRIALYPDPLLAQVLTASTSAMLRLPAQLPRSLSPPVSVVVLSLTFSRKRGPLVAV
jgi:hypothetical protein